MKRLYDCPPTLTDSQVLDVCRKGFLMLEGVVPAWVNRKTVDYLDAHPEIEPVGILGEEWFVENVICHPLAAGAVRSLLGKDFGLPILMSNHRVRCPVPAQNWHRDGGSKYEKELHTLQVFYYPEACPREMGPTELLPGSHFLFAPCAYMGHYGAIRGTFSAAAPAGSIFLTIYSIWHRRGRSTGSGIRNMLKYCYWRTVPPQRDWVLEPDFDFADGAHYSLAGTPTFREQFRDCRDTAELFFWLCGFGEKYAHKGGQGWPLPANFVDTPYGFPLG
jgi:hypothetical protein